MALAWLALSCAAPALADFKLNMPRGVTATSREVYDLHMLGLWVCVAIGALVYGAMIVAIVRFRKSAHPKPAKFSHNTTMEVVWTVIRPILVAPRRARRRDADQDEGHLRDSKAHHRGHGLPVALAVQLHRRRRAYERARPAATRRAGSTRGIDPYTVENHLLDVDRPLVVPVDTKVRLLITSADVAHAWWVPDLAVKQDAVPGFVRDAWFEADTEGTYRGQCAELCGQDHGFMPIVVEVVSKEKFAAWLDGQKQPSQ